MKLFYSAGDHGAWSLDSQYILKERDAAPPNFEVANIDFLRRHTSIPLPEVVRAWKEQNGKYFEVISRLPGQNLQEVQESSGEADIKHIATQVAGQIQEIRKLTSDRMESLDGEPLFSAFLFDAPYTPHGPFDTDGALYSEMVSLLEVTPEIGKMLRERALKCEPYTFTHGDLTNLNIMVNDGNLSGIIDFESSGYYPVWWESVKCSVEFSQEDLNWKVALQEEIETFPEAMKWYQAYTMLKRRPDSQEALDILDKLPEISKRA